MCSFTVAVIGGAVILGNLIGYSLARAAAKEMPTPPARKEPQQ